VGRIQPGGACKPWRGGEGRGKHSGGRGGKDAGRWIREGGGGKAAGRCIWERGASIWGGGGAGLQGVAFGKRGYYITDLI
jgi:hypothetical protein